MDLGPSNDKPFLRSLQLPCHSLDHIDPVDGSVFAVVGVEMRPVVTRAGLGKHSHDDPEEPAQLRQTASFSCCQPSECIVMNACRDPRPR
jgi:hypothetical protein